MIERRAFFKWTLITLFCGAHSFFLGCLTNAHIPAMAAGVITLILLFSFIECHPRYRARRSGNILFARAMDKGIAFRLCCTVYIAVCYFFMSTGIIQRLGTTLSLTLMAPYVGEVYIGMFTLQGMAWLTGLPLQHGFDRHYEMSSAAYVLATYMATVITGLVHTLILASFCGIIYAVLSWKKGNSVNRLPG